MKRWQHRVWKTLAALVAAAVILLATLAGLFRIAAPLVPQYRAAVQDWASRALGYPVSIVAMGAQLGLRGPEITLEQVKILSPDRQRIVTEARQIRLGVTLGALLRGRLSHPSLIVLVQPRVVIQRDLDGSFGVRGLAGSLNAAREQTNWRQVAAELFGEPAEIVVRDAEVTFIDMHAPAQPQVFRNLDLKLDNSADSHELKGSLTPPPAFGHYVAFDARIEGASPHPETWQWQTVFEGDALDLPAWLAYWPEYAGRFTSGTLDLHATLAGNGAVLTSTEAAFNARQVLPAGANSGSRGFTTLSGRVSWARSTTGWHLRGQAVKLASAASAWPVSGFDLDYNRTPEGGTLWSGDASFLRLQDLVTLAGWLPASLSADTARLRRLALRGDVMDAKFNAEWNGSGFSHWSVAGRFDDLGVQADGPIPGFSGLGGTLDLNQDGGLLTLAAHQVSATFPQLFRGPLSAATLQGRIQFTHDAAGWSIGTQDLSLANADANAQIRGSLRLPAGGGAPVADITATASNGRVQNKSVYLPVGIMPKEVVTWLDSSIVKGQVPTASFTLQGALDKFPFDKGGGLFDVRFHLLNGVLDYADGWPKVTNLDADVEFKNAGMRAEIHDGLVAGARISGATAQFTDLSNGRLQIDGQVRGSAQATLDFLRSGPLKARFGDYLSDLKAGGRSDVSLHLLLPVDEVEKFELRGRDELREASLQLPAYPAWEITRLTGSVTFTGDGASSDNLQGQFMGAPLTVRFKPGTGRDEGNTLFTATGTAQARALQTALAAPAQLGLSGAAAWQLTGSMPNSPAQNTAGLTLTLNSNLDGLAVSLPSPFGKPAAGAAPLTASLQLMDAQHLQVAAEYAGRVRGLWSFTHTGPNWRFERGDLHFGSGSAALPSSPGLNISGQLADFAFDDWRTHLRGSGSGPLLPAWLGAMDLDIGRLSVFGQNINALHIGMTRSAAAAHLTLASSVVAGEIVLPDSVDDTHPIVADLTQLSLMRNPATAKASSSATFDPRRIPAINFTSKKFNYDDSHLTNVQLQLRPATEGVTLQNLAVADPAFNIRGNGNWLAPAGAPQQCDLNLNLQSRDVAGAMQAFGYQPGITGSHGELQAQVHWQGTPFGGILPTLSGKLHIKLQNGRLLEVKPGAGRLFGLLSINALPRRLLLNFSDVFGKGFAYDSIEGDFTLENGDAYTGDLQANGPAAKIHVVGRTGLVKRDFDEALIVDPSVGSTLPVVGALAASSVGVGAVLLILTEIFKKPLTAVGEVRYHLTGTWDNPQLEKIVEPKPRSAPAPSP